MAIDITGIDRVELLRCLHNRTTAVGMGRLHDLKRDMTYAEAEEIIRRMTNPEEELEFDYVKGRPIKVLIKGSTLLHEHLFDRDAGKGACEEVVMELKTRQAHTNE